MSDIKYESTKPLEEFKVVKEAKMRKTSGDLISRDKAIEMINKTIKSNKSIHYEMKYWEDGMNCARQIVEQLPSADLQIIYCKDCKWFNKLGCAIRIVDDTDRPNEDDFCSFAERRHRMKDTIYRDDAIKCCRNEWEEEVEERLRLLPSAERVGHWIDMNTPTSMYMPRYKCSICGNSANYSKYCPNCGAKMKGEQNERAETVSVLWENPNS